MIAVVAPTDMVKGKSKVKTTSKTVLLALAKFTLTGGQTKAVTLSLNGTGSRLLSQRHRLAAELTVEQAGHMVSRRTVSFTASAANKRH